ncbi:MAG: cytochrome c [Acidobacteriaceae bacterium]|jgi:mono/diheme cytochrome c family protein
MPKLIKAALLAGLMSAIFLGFAQQPTPTTPKIKTVPIQPTSPTSGQQMYATYCAVCHGADGRGNGPAAPALGTPPTDLTALSRKSGGVFPADHIFAVLKFGLKNPAHGSAEMPIWGDLMLTLDRNSPNSAVVVHERIVNLTSYLQQMQK